MKLLRARFENFRLLRDLELEFSTDPVRKLTVIRAENETGKTTILTALQWALYGDEALPGDARSYRLHPIDWKDPNPRVRVQVEVDFETTVPGRAGGADERHRFRVIRTVTEEVQGALWTRGQSNPVLLQLAAPGARPLDQPESRIRAELPPELREVFFTDGDRALSFIDADSNTVKRERVEKAIRALLGLSILEKSAEHVRQASQEVNRKVKESDAGTRAKEASGRIEKLDDEIAAEQTALDEASAARLQCDEQADTLTKQIEALLAKGDRAQLAEQLQSERRARKREEELALKLAREHAELFQSTVLARQLLSTQISSATAILDGLRHKGQIPNQTIPVLEDRLAQGTCICGASLDPENPDACKRRDHIHELIETSRAADETQRIITELYYGAQNLMTPVAGKGWPDLYADVFDKRQKLAKTIAERGAAEALLEQKIDAIPDVDLQALQRDRRTARDQAARYADAATRAAAAKENAEAEKRGLESQRNAHLKEWDKGRKLVAELSVAQDVLAVFRGALDRLKQHELALVSELMNDIFLEMIGADPDQGAIIQRAEISSEFDILVYGPEGRQLDPDRDLNGASRRALTLAFILALTKISEVEAPNIIDTPLGMMSGFVKQSVVKTAIEHSSQLILFLTRDEIKGCETLIDEFADKVMTLTNPAHYPKILVNRPPVADMRALRCECSHREECDLCRRRSALSEASDEANRLTEEVSA